MKKRLLIGILFILLINFVYAEDCYTLGNVVNLTTLLGTPAYGDTLWNHDLNQYVVAGWLNPAAPYNFNRFNSEGIIQLSVYSNNLTDTFVWTGTEYGSVRAELNSSTKKYVLLFNSFNPDGSSKLKDRIISGSISFSQSEPTRSNLVWNGNEYALAWTEDYPSNSAYWTLYFTRFRSDGVKISVDMKIGNGSYRSTTPSLIWDGNNYVVAWRDKSSSNVDIRLAKIQTDGTIISWRVEDNPSTNDVGYCTTYYDCHVSLTFSGSDYGIVWNQQSGLSKHIMFAKVNANTFTKIGTDIILNSAPLFMGQYPSIIWNGNEYAVVWSDYDNKIYLLRIYPNGTIISNSRTLLGNKGSDVSGEGGKTRIIWNGSAYGTFWHIWIGNKEAFRSYNKIPCPICSPNGAIQQCGTDIGECSYGTQTCVSSSWSNCAGDIGPVAEICDGLDNDCNDLIDDITDLNTFQDGVCIGSLNKCIGNVATDDYNLITDYEATETTCDDVSDNDCDGIDDANDPDCTATIDCASANNYQNCHTAGDCYWIIQTLDLQGGDCKDIITDPPADCSGFNDDSIACNNNLVHGLGCSYNSVDSICEESLITCGNVNIDPGEDCLTCQEDAGCISGYCQSSGLCGGSADSSLADDNNRICEAGETCGGNDCVGEQAGCASGYLCDSVNMGGGCVVDNDMIDPSQLNCADLDGVDCPSADAYNEPQYCISIWNDGLPYIQTIQTLDTNNCCLTGQCGSTDTPTGVTGQVRLLNRGNCIPIGEGVEGSMRVTTTVYDGNGQIVPGSQTQTTETCYISKKTVLPFYNFISILITLIILIGFYLRFSKKQ